MDQPSQWPRRERRRAAGGRIRQDDQGAAARRTGGASEAGRLAGCVDEELCWQGAESNEGVMKLHRKREPSAKLIHFQERWQDFCFRQPCGSLDQTTCHEELWNHRGRGLSSATSSHKEDALATGAANLPCSQALRQPGSQAGMWPGSWPATRQHRIVCMLPCPTMAQEQQPTGVCTACSCSGKLPDATPSLGLARPGPWHTNPV